MKLKKLFEDILREKSPVILKNPTKEEIEDFVSNNDRYLRFIADTVTKNIYFWDSRFLHRFIVSNGFITELEPYKDKIAFFDKNLKRFINGESVYYNGKLNFFNSDVINSRYERGKSQKYSEKEIFFMKKYLENVDTILKNFDSLKTN